MFYSDNFELKEQTATEPKVLQIELIPIKKGASMVLKNVFFETVPGLCVAGAQNSPALRGQVSQGLYGPRGDASFQSD